MSAFILSARRRILLKSLLAAAAAAVPLAGRGQERRRMAVYKSAGCGCCAAWITHLERHGFAVEAHDVPSPGDYRARAGIPQELGACHTGMVDGYAIEGHVPAADITRLLSQRPKARGLAVPAMPMGAPGMEGDRADPFDVFLVDAEGRRSVYAHHGA